MAWTNLVFTIGQIFAASDANALVENTRQARITHKGPLQPDLPEAGVRWLDDNLPVQVEKFYTGSNWLPTLFVDMTAGKTGLHPQGALWGSIPMVTKTEDKTAFAGVPTQLKNVLLNAQMNYWQRGSSLAQIDDNIRMTADRWALETRQNGKVAWSQVAETPEGSPSDYSYQITVLSGSGMSSGSVVSLLQAVEGTTLARFMFGRSTARYTRTSCWIWSNVTGRISWGISNWDPPGWITNTGWMDITAASTWLFKEFGFIRPTTGNWNTGIDIGAVFQITFAAHSNYITSTPSAWVYNSPDIRAVSGQLNGVSAAGTIFRVTDIQWEMGDMATPIDVLPPALEKLLLSRYYWKTFDERAPPVQASGQYEGLLAMPLPGNGAPVMNVRYTPMRVPPYLTFYNPANSSALWYDVSVGANLQVPVPIWVGEQSLTLNVSVGCTGNASHIAIVHMSADAEFF